MPRRRSRAAALSRAGLQTCSWSTMVSRLPSGETGLETCSTIAMKVTVILPAAGLGTRMSRPAPEKAGTSRKQFMLLDGAPILLYTIRKFVASPWVSEIVVALRGDDIAWFGD